MDNKSLVLDLVEWIADRPRAYDDVMDAWRTSCPRLSVWEDAVDAGYVRRHKTDDGTYTVSVTQSGIDILDLERPDRTARSA